MAGTCRSSFRASGIGIVSAAVALPVDLVLVRREDGLACPLAGIGGDALAAVADQCSKSKCMSLDEPSARSLARQSYRRWR